MPSSLIGLSKGTPRSIRRLPNTPTGIDFFCSFLFFQSSENCRSRDVLCPTSDAGAQACPWYSLKPGWDPTPPDTAKLGTAANPAGSQHGHSNCSVPRDPMRHYAGSTSQCSTAPLLEISVNSNHSASPFDQRVCHASGGGKAATKLASEIALKALPGPQSTNSRRNGNNGALKLRSGNGRDCNIAFGSSKIISSSSNRQAGQQQPASNQPKDLISTQALRQLQGGRIKNMSEPQVLPRRDHGFFMGHGMGQQGRCQGADSNSHRKQAAVAGQDERGQKASSSTGNKRKALMKAIVRTTPTRAPSLLSKTSQLSCFSTGLDSITQCQNIEILHSRSSCVSDATSFQSQQPLAGPLHGKEVPVLPYPALGALEAESKSDALADLGIAESCTFPDCQSGMGQSMGKSAAGTILESVERRAVKRSLLSQPGFH